MNRSELKSRTKAFASRCIKPALALPNTYLGNHLKGQLIRSSTSVAANYRATCLAQSKAAFIAKLSIVVEEVDESLFWIELIIDENLIENNLCDPLKNEANELTAICVSTRKTASQKKTKSSIIHRPS